jgi:hypothetical protein
MASAYGIDLRIAVSPSSPLAGFFASNGFDRVLAIYPTLRAALTVPRASREGTRTALWPRCPVEGAFGHPHLDRLAAGLARAAGRARAATTGPP